MRDTSILGVIHRCSAAYIAFLTHSRVTLCNWKMSYTTKRWGSENRNDRKSGKTRGLGTNTFIMAEIEADDQWSLRSTMQSARIWLQDIEGSFAPLGRPLESAEGQRNTASYDSAEFFSRRLRENERTLVTFELSRDFDRIAEDWESYTFTAPSSLDDRLSTVARNGLVDRPRLQILQQQL